MKNVTWVKSQDNFNINPTLFTNEHREVYECGRDGGMDAGNPALETTLSLFISGITE